MPIKANFLKPIKKVYFEIKSKEIKVDLTRGETRQRKRGLKFQTQGTIISILNLN